MKRPAKKMPPYVWARPQTHVFWFRMAVPQSVRDRVGKSVWQCTLGTTDIRQAAALAQDKRNQLMREWGLLSASTVGSPTVRLDRLAVEIGFDNYLGALDDARRQWPKAPGEYEARLDQVPATRRRYTREILDGDKARWEQVADNNIAKRGLALRKATPEYEAFVETIAESTLDALDVFERRTTGDLAAAPKSQAVTKAKELAKPGETLLQLFERWSSERLAKGEKRPDTVNQDRKIIEQFSGYVGKDRAVGSITPQEVFDYREILRDLPPKWTSNKQLARLGMKDAAVRARELGLPQTAFTTVNKHLSTISPLYKWLASQPAWVGLRNPCDGLFHDKVKGKNPRPPFTTPVLNTILRSPLFAGFLADGAEHEPGNHHADDWRKWIPLVCMFTGARIGEIAQLRIGDVRQQHGVWFIFIAHDGDAKQSTKSGESRTAAVHAKLEAIGFIKFVERHRERAGGDDGAQLFPELKPNNRGQIGAEPSRWWRDYLTAIRVKQGRDGIGAHSFRHELSDRLREEALLLDNEIAVCLGHSVKSTTGGYGKIRQGTVAMLKDWIDAVRWDGVNFDALFKLPNEKMVEAPVS
ncbi:MAG TPA: tyrosine-type recombinase/integrase [Sphingopyxis sp.]|jgi:integrase|uniref:tyrosine-type recombinase/integrase n=1 Tax=Sphingopyxis sp. TaxID=1908224 RepID=UPI002E0E39F1|nr:tyrosine-type recombinase/integrase [Sphingopyxis sp.]